MRTIGFIALIVCTSALSASAQEVSSSGAAESKVRALEISWAAAERRNNNNTLDALFADSLLFVDYDGELLTKAEYLARIGSAGPKVLEAVTENMSVRVLGNTAIVIGVYREKGLRNGKPYQQRRRFIDTWVRENGNWVCVAAAATLLPR